MLFFSGMRSGEPIGGEMVRLRTPRFLLKLPKEVREEARLWVVVPAVDIGEGLGNLILGDVVGMRDGEVVPVRGGGEDAPEVRRCCSSGGSWVLWPGLTSDKDLAFCSSCSITAA